VNERRTVSPEGQEAMTNPGPILSRDQVAERLAVKPKLLVRFEARGLIRPTTDGRVEGYAPSEIRRIWTVLSLRRDLGINLAGIEAILKLRDQLDVVHSRLFDLADRLRDVLESDDGPAA